LKQVSRLNPADHSIFVSQIEKVQLQVTKVITEMSVMTHKFVLLVSTPPLFFFLICTLIIIIFF
jgi:hypothetical protein